MSIKKMMAIIMAATMVVSMVACSAKPAGEEAVSEEEQLDLFELVEDNSEEEATLPDLLDEDEAAVKQLSENVELSLQDFVESISFAGDQVNRATTYEEYANMFGAEYYGADVTEDMAFSEYPASFEVGSTDIEMGLFYFDEGVRYGINVFSYTDGLSDSYTQMSFNTDGSMYDASTTIADSTWNSGEDFTCLEGFSEFAYYNSCQSLADFIKTIGLDTLDSNYVTTANAIMAGEFTSCTGSFETEYGQAQVDITCFTVNPEYPTAYLTITFAEPDRAPMTSYAVTESIYGSFVDSGTYHSITFAANE